MAAQPSSSQPRGRMTSWPVLGFVLRAWEAIDLQSHTERSASDFDLSKETWRVRQILLLAAILLALGYSFGDRPFFLQSIAPSLSRFPNLAKWIELLSYIYWSAAKILGFGVLPFLHLRALGLTASDCGLGTKPTPSPVDVPKLPWGKTYLLLLALILPIVAIASTTAGFRENYPFYRQAGRSLTDFLGWEIPYLCTFVAVEFFFRGYLLFGLKRVFGSHALFVSMVPYCMIHILKPPAEALGSIFAGLLLGTLALSTGSLWCGVLLHVTVALTMDLLTLLH